MWNFFRLENEHLNNCGQFRAVRDISIAPINANDQALLEQMMDNADGVTNRLKTCTWRVYVPLSRYALLTTGGKLGLLINWMSVLRYSNQPISSFGSSYSAKTGTYSKHDISLVAIESHFALTIGFLVKAINSSVC